MIAEEFESIWNNGYSRVTTLAQEHQRRLLFGSDLRFHHGSSITPDNRFTPDVSCTRIATQIIDPLIL